MKKMSNFRKNLIKELKRLTSLESLIGDRSEEYYFGESNPLKDGLISTIESIREVVRTKKQENPNATPRDIMPFVRPYTESLKTIIKDSFNIEGIAIGWANWINACCFIQISNNNIYGKDKKAEELKVKLNDIITVDNKGFRYRKKDGIYYCVVLGYPIFADDRMFSTEEAAAILVHELGHAMQHVVTSLQESISVTLYQMLYINILPYINQIKPSERKYFLDLADRLRKAIKKGDRETLKNIGDEWLKDQQDKNGIDFSNKTDEELEDDIAKSSGRGSDWENDKIDQYNKKAKPGIGKKIWLVVRGILRGWLSVAFYIIAIIYIKSSFKKMQNKDNDFNEFKVFEETADHFTAMYGLGVAMAKVSTVFAKMSKDFNPTSLIERLPLLDCFSALTEMRSDMNAFYNGYPTDKQRMINMYKAATFELKNNKDLTQKDKNELLKQIEDYKKIYEVHRSNDKKKSFLYKLIAGIQRQSLEEAAAKDNFVTEQVLIPLQKRADPSFNPDDIYDDPELTNEK